MADDRPRITVKELIKRLGWEDATSVRFLYLPTEGKQVGSTEYLEPVYREDLLRKEKKADG